MYTLSPWLESLMCCKTESIRLSMFGIWYLFLWIALFKVFESRANLTDLSFLTVITIVEIKFLSKHSCKFSICSWPESFFSSSDTLCNKFIGTRLFDVMGYTVYEILSEMYVTFTYQFWKLNEENRLQFVFWLDSIPVLPY